jgi:hypothetical protein
MRAAGASTDPWLSLALTWIVAWAAARASLKVTVDRPSLRSTVFVLEVIVLLW